MEFRPRNAHLAADLAVQTAAGGKILPLRRRRMADGKRAAACPT